MIRLEVEWLDSGAIRKRPEDGWETKEQILQNLKVTTVTTVGLKFGEDDQCLYVALNYDAYSDMWFGVQAIDKSNIKKITLLTPEPESPSAEERKPLLFETAELPDTSFHILEHYGINKVREDQGLEKQDA